jgi:L-amino acid N-acyltransferase YncA
VAAKISLLRQEHWPAVRDIYEAGIATGNATFETTAPDWSTWDSAHLTAHRLVALDDNAAVLGWTAVTSVSARCVYAGVVEHSVYVHPAHQGTGVGQQLLLALIASTEAAGIWTIQTGIFPENTASLAAHERVGFRVVGAARTAGSARRQVAGRAAPGATQRQSVVSADIGVPVVAEADRTRERTAAVQRSNERGSRSEDGQR